MISIDTNVFVRAFADDDLAQSKAARTLIRTLTVEAPGFISLTVCLELYWVLERVLKVGRTATLDAFDRIMSTPAFEVEDGESVGEALEAARRGADFADALIDATNRLYGITETVSFDRSAADHFGWRLLS